MNASADSRAELFRLEILDALVIALERRVEVGEAIASSADAQEAVRRVQDLLGVTETGATEVLNMQWRRWTREEGTKLRSHRDDVRARRDARVAQRDAMPQTD